MARFSKKGAVLTCVLLGIPLLVSLLDPVLACLLLFSGLVIAAWYLLRGS